METKWWRESSRQAISFLILTRKKLGCSKLRNRNRSCFFGSMMILKMLGIVIFFRLLFTMIKRSWNVSQRVYNNDVDVKSYDLVNTSSFFFSFLNSFFSTQILTLGFASARVYARARARVSLISRFCKSTHLKIVSSKMLVKILSN